MLKSIFKLFAAIAAFAAGFAFFSSLSRRRQSDYIEIYSSDDEDDTF